MNKNWKKRSPIKPIGYLNEQILEKEGTNIVSWLPKKQKLEKEGSNKASWLPERT